jgi:hypothetical protein
MGGLPDSRDVLIQKNRNNVKAANVGPDVALPFY